MKLQLLSSFFALSTIVNAVLVPTAPIAATEWDARRAQVVEWIDDNQEPRLNDLANISIQLFTGSTFQQSFLQDLTGTRNIKGTRNSISVRFDQDLGPDGQYYFLRFRSDDLTEDVFSAKFTLDHMTGTFNSTIQAQLSASGALPSAAGLPTASAGIRTAENDAPLNSASGASASISTGSRLPAGTSVTRAGVVESSAISISCSSALVLTTLVMALLLR